MANLRDLRRRVRSVKSTQQITRAMKLVAASKLRRAQAEMEEGRAYAEGIGQLVEHLGQRTGLDAHPLMTPSDGNRTLLTVISADRGLCGAFNSNVMKEAERFLERNGGKREIALELIGRKASDYFGRRSHAVRAKRTDVFRTHDFEMSRAISGSLIEAFTEEDFDEVVLLSNRFRTVMSQEVVLQRLLPAGQPEVVQVALPGEEEAEEEPMVALDDYLYEPDPESLVEAIVPSSVELQVHQALLESHAAEMGARMVAMENATNNASEMIDHLTLLMNRSRQAAITTEIIEVVGGAAALDE